MGNGHVIGLLFENGQEIAFEILAQQIIQKFDGIGP